MFMQPHTWSMVPADWVLSSLWRAESVTYVRKSALNPGSFSKKLFSATNQWHTINSKQGFLSVNLWKLISTEGRLPASLCSEQKGQPVQSLKRTDFWKLDKCQRRQLMSLTPCPDNVASTWPRSLPHCSHSTVWSVISNNWRPDRDAVTVSPDHSSEIAA